jgi:predicted ATPase
MAVGGVAVCGALSWGLSQRTNTSSSSTELYNTSNKQPPEGLAALPRDYASVMPARSGVPVLGPPLPGDLGRPILAAQGVAGPTGLNAEQQRRAQEREAFSIVSPVICLQFRRYQGSQIFAFDFGGSIRAAALAMGGDWHDLGGALSDDAIEPVALQPLASISDLAEQGWAAQWLAAILVREGVTLSPEAKEHIWSALRSLASAPTGERTLTGLSLAYSNEAITLHNPSFPSLASWVQDPLVMARIFVFRSLHYLGYLDQAHLRREEALSEARRSPHAHTLAMLLTIAFECDVYTMCDPKSLLERADELVTLSRKHGFPYWLSCAVAGHGATLAELGCSEEGISDITEALRMLKMTGVITGVSDLLIYLAQVFGKTGRAREGLEQLDEAVRQMEAMTHRYKESEAHRVRGELLIATGDPQAAEASFLKAINVACHQGAKLWEIRAATNLARLWRDQGRRGEARDLLAPVYNWFTEGFDTPVLQEAKALIEELH